MQTLKTAVVVVLLLIVFYGVYEMLNRPPDAPPSDVAQMDEIPFDPPEIQFGEATAPPSAEPAFSVPSMSDAGTPPSPVPSQSMVAAPGMTDTASPTGTPAWNEYPQTSPEAGSLPPQPPDIAPPMTVTPPQWPGPDPRAPLPDAHSMAATGPLPPQMPPADPRLQQNPFVNEPVVARPPEGPNAVGPTSGDQTGARAYERARKLAQTMIDQGQFHQALATLSVFYQSEDLTPEQQGELIDLLDPLAGRVVYSQEHCIEPACTVRRNETLFDIAQRYNVPAELLQKINGIEDPNVLVPGTELKVVTGPFRADVDLRTQQLTLFVNGLYAGRFPISVGNDPAPVAGEFQVRDKRADRDYFSIEGRVIPAGNPANPFGNVWLDLGREICIHGSPAGGADPRRGCISLSPQDADDVYGILSVGSNVRILR
ncbi:MAG: LysM peptidoglycan-binding domain-containing protein [Pirellulaceae bacterium]|nr:LysM peptidoglycan-binding domain-containing protein [Pirellulaceae bacterium]